MEDLGFKNKKISLLGFSQGAILSWSLGIEYPHLIKNILPLSGFTILRLQTLIGF